MIKIAQRLARMQASHRRIDLLKFVVFAVVYIGSCSSFITYMYYQAKETIDQQVNTKLYDGALMVVAALGDQYNESIKDQHSITPEQDWQTIQKLTYLSNQLGLSYIYTVIKKDGQAILTSSSASADELKNNSYVRFYTPYPDVSSALMQSFKTHKVTWSDYTDHWGRFRAVFIPRKLSNGQYYVVGAEISLRSYYQKLHNEEWKMAGFGIFLFIDFSIFVGIYLTYIRYKLYQLKQQTEQLSVAQRSAIQANQAKSDFVRNISHEIRTPLNGVVGASELISHTELSDEQRHYLKILQSSNQSLLALINDILDVSKIESGKFELENKVFELREVLERPAQVIRAQLLNKDVQLQVKTDTRFCEYVVGDEKRLQQVLINLLGNAAKFTHSGSICLSLTQIPRNKTEINLLIRVKDTGKGIAKEKLALIFQPFSQVEPNASEERQGSGLGLSISKKYIEAMGGSIVVESEPGKGSIFTICVPVKIAQLVHQHSPQHLVLPDCPAMNVVLADDSRTNQLITRSMLEKLGHQVSVVSDGQQVLEICHKQHVDVILMDINMKHVNGLEATRQLRASPEHMHVYIIAYTANAYVDDTMRHLRSGMDDVLIKPISLANLRQTLLRAYKKISKDGNHI
ncbi:ATP-binding protein [Celerinatantimonas sp. MCCC 1A17872]|uniref:ATP-binding protein n=1 Tax=Celerinatantimonas sp. MCCC 1A17872 TaxID=3177514 RepID=UPI0038C09DA1